MEDKKICLDGKSQIKMNNYSDFILLMSNSEKEHINGSKMTKNVPKWPLFDIFNITQHYLTLFNIIQHYPTLLNIIQKCSTLFKSI